MKGVTSCLSSFCKYQTPDLQDPDLTLTLKLTRNYQCVIFIFSIIIIVTIKLILCCYHCCYSYVTLVHRLVSLHW